MTPSWILFAAALLLPSPQDDRPALLADDLRFAENLALYRFYDLSDSVVKRVQDELAKLPGDQLALDGEARLVAARVHKRRAETSADPGEQLEEFGRAVDILGQWTRPGSPFAYLDRLVDAYEDLADVLRQRGKLHARRFLEGDAEAQKRAEDDFKAAEQAYRDLAKEAEARADQLAELGREDQAAAMRLRGQITLFRRGLNSIEWSEVASDGEFRLDQAIEQIDEFLWELQDKTLVYWEAMFEWGRAHHMRGLSKDARDLLVSIDGELSYSWDELDEYAPALQAGLASVLDSVWGYLAVVAADLEGLDAGQAWIDRMLSRHDAVKRPLSRAGMAAGLEWAQRLREAGRVGPAVELVKRIADDGRGQPEGQIATELLAEAVSQGEVEVRSVAVLMDVARGHVGKGQHADAAFTFLRAADAIESDAERAQYALDAWTGAARALTKSNRHLEAALAYEQALQLVQALQLGTEALESAAMGMYRAYDQRFAETQLAFDKTLRDDASARLLAIPGIELDLAFLKATEAFAEVTPGDAQGFLAVLEEFRSVPKSSPNHERALAYVGRCLMEAGQHEQALAEFEQLEKRFADPAHEPRNAIARNKREIAMAQCLYYHALLLLQPQVARPAEALALLTDFESKVPGQEAFHDNAALKRIEALAASGDLPAAEKALAEFEVECEQPALVSRAAYVVASALEKAARAAADPAGRRALLLRAARAMWLYAEKDGFSSFNNLATTGDWYLEAGAPDEAQRVFQKTVDVFSRKLEPTQLDRAWIGLAQAFDDQRDFGRSRPVWKDLLDRNPSSTRIRRGAARSFGGWLEANAEGQIVEVDGSGNFDEAFDLWLKLYEAANVNNKFTALWWEAKLGSIYNLYRLGAQDQQRARNARLVLDQLKVMQPEYDEGTIGELPPESRYAPLYKPLYRYLDRQLPVR